MDVIVKDDEIIITLKKENHKELFDRVPVMTNPKKYFEYLLSLDVQLNGTEDVMQGFLSITNAKNEIKNLSNEELLTRRNQTLEDMCNYPNYILEAIPEDYVYAFEDEGIMHIPEDDAVSYLKYCADMMRCVIAELKRRGISK